MTSVRELADLVFDRVGDSPKISAHRQRPTNRPAKGYVVFYFGPGSPVRDGRLHGDADLRSWTFQAVCVGYSDDQALFVAQIVSDLLAGWRPEPDNRSAGCITQRDDDPPILSDEVDGDVRWSTTLTFHYSTNRS